VVRETEMSTGRGATPDRALLLRLIVRWAVPVLWVAVAVAGGDAIGDALDGRSGAVRLVAIVGAWLGWAVAAVASVVPSTVSLTVLRAIVPGSIGVAAACGLAGATAGSVALSAALCVATSAMCATAEFGLTMAQASAYGDEVRIPLRAPVGYALPAAVSWVLWASSVIVAPLLLAAGVWASGIPLAALAVAGTVLLPRRWHQLSRRWLVFVPAGVVVHDRVVLAETLMVRRHDVRSLSLALVGTEAVDLTGPAAGHAVEVTTAAPVRVLRASASRRGTATELTLRAFLVAPSRPGAALTEAARRRLPLGP